MDTHTQQLALFPFLVLHPPLSYTAEYPAGVLGRCEDKAAGHSKQQYLQRTAPRAVDTGQSCQLRQMQWPDSQSCIHLNLSWWKHHQMRGS